MSPRPASGRASIGQLTSAVFIIVTLIASIMVYAAYIQQRNMVALKVGHAEAQRTANLIFEHLYSVMRKGWTRDEIDDVVHHIRRHLPDYDISVVRGEPVARQFGDIAGHAALRNDPLVSRVIAGRNEIFEDSEERMRYGFPLRMSSECVSCHTTAQSGEVNGVIVVSIPSERLREPIEAAVRPTILWIGAVVVILFGAIFIALRRRVVDPIIEFTEHVRDAAWADGGGRFIARPKHWPNEIDSLAASFNSLMGEVESSQLKLEEASLHDALTGLFNRRHFDITLQQAITDVDGGAEPFAVLLLDLDRFKPVNDRYGHAAGDALLVAVAQAIHSALRETDMAARIGGDEFAVLALSAHAEAVHELTERVRMAIATLTLRFGDETLTAACSIGAVIYPEAGHSSAANVLRAADAAMYIDKARRKNVRP